MGTRKLDAQDLYRIRQVNDPQVSPDGRLVVYTVTQADENDNTYRAALWVHDLDSGENRRLTSGKQRDGQPRWSPDGSRIAFTSDRNPDEKGKGQIWTIAVDGGEPTRLTALEEPVEEFAWSPNGGQLAAVAKVRSGASPSPHGVRVITTVRFRFDGEGYLDDKYRQVFVINATDGSTRQLTEGPYEHRTLAWSPTGHEIAFSSNRNEGWEFSPVHDIYAVRVAGNTVRKISDGTGRWSQPSWSPDGTRIACYGTRRIESSGARSELFVVSAGGGAPESISADFDRGFGDASIADVVSFPGRAPLWSAAGDSVSAVYSDAGTVQVARVDLAGGDVVPLTSGRRRHGALAALPGGGYVFAANDAVSPGEIYACDANGGAMRQLTNHNAEWLADVDVTEPEPFTVNSADGLPIHGWILKPPGMEAGRRYPMALEIHGGPFGMYSESMMHEFHLLAANGYVVLFTNPRGSAGYGDDFAGRLYRAWGINDFPDQMAAVDWAIEQGYVDPERMGVLGGSYGGFMTNWVITHTNRFKAAVTGRTVSNLYSSFGTDDIMFADTSEITGATPWEDPDIFWELSPIAYVDQIETPLLIEHQEDDHRCPMEQAEQLFISLKRRGKTVEFLRFPDESHGMSRTGQPTHRIERLGHILRWFNTYLAV